MVLGARRSLVLSPLIAKAATVTTGDGIKFETGQGPRFAKIPIKQGSRGGTRTPTGVTPLRILSPSKSHSRSRAFAGHLRGIWVNQGPTAFFAWESQGRRVGIAWPRRCQICVRSEYTSFLRTRRASLLLSCQLSLGHCHQCGDDAPEIAFPDRGLTNTFKR